MLLINLYVICVASSLSSDGRTSDSCGKSEHRQQSIRDKVAKLGIGLKISRSVGTRALLRYGRDVWKSHSGVYN